MNSGALHPSWNKRALPPLLATALLACCAWSFLQPPQEPTHRTDSSAVRSIGDSDTMRATPLVPVNSLPGVLSLPPATLAGSANAPSTVQHQPPPPASRNAFRLADLKAQMPQRADGTFLIDVPTLYFSAGDPAARQVIEGQFVETTAQLRPDPLHPALFQLTRSLTRCCSADSRAYSIAVEPGVAMPSLPDGTWVTVTGTIGYRREIGGYGPVIHAATIKQVPPPAIPILK